MHFFDLPDELVHNNSQIAILNRLSKIILMLEEKQHILSIFSKYRQDQTQGIYLFGAVGRGKTTLMQAFFHRVDIDRKKFVHYQDFMQSVHSDIHKLRAKSTDKIVSILAKNYARNIQILCIDEFEIVDIADAMIIRQLFPALINNKVFIFVTSNTAPDNLYQDGIQREAFLPFIQIIKGEFEVLEVTADHDYRLNKLQNVSQRILYPINAENELIIYKTIMNLGGEDKFTPGYIEFFGRRLDFNKVYNKTLLTNFNELFERELGYIDYVNICKKFTIIIIPDIQSLDPDNSNLITRFINFIDNAYFYKVLLFMLMETPPEKICPNLKNTDNIKRAVSRIHEMAGNLYLKTIYEKI